MVLGVSTALLWMVWPHVGWLPALPDGLAGIHGFVVGTSVGLLVIVIGTVAGRPAPKANIDQAWDGATGTGS